MKAFMLLFSSLLALLAQAWSVPPVLNYAGQVAVNGEAFDGNGLFKFALVNADGTTSYWSNDGTSVDGSEPQASVAVAVNGGLYSILLGNNAQQGMGAIDPAMFAQHNDAKLRVWFSDGVNGFQQLSPDRPFASVPYAFSAGTAQSAGSANIANGSVNLDMLSQDVKTQINAPIGLNRLSSEVTAKLDQNGSGVAGVVAGSLISLPYGQSAPAGYSLFQRGTPKELVWEEKAPVSVARHAYDGVEVLGGKIYFVGGHGGSSKNIAERYDPVTNTWESLNSMSVARHGVASAVLNGKFYAIGGINGSNNLSSVEIYDPSTESWSVGLALPSAVNHASAMIANGKIYLIGGKNASNQKIDQVLCFDPSTNQWSTKANMPTARESMKLIWFGDRIWAIGGYSISHTKIVESYDPNTDSWQTEASLNTSRHWAVAWVANSRIYAGGGGNSTSYLDSIEVYDPATKQWSNLGNFPENKYVADAVILNDKVYVIAGATTTGAYSNKVYAADLNASVAGVYDLYRKDGNASAGTPLVQAEVADGSVTGSKMADGAITTDKLNEQILKYLKPEITAQPQAQTVYADSNVSFSISAEGKYLTYQWKKDGVDLTGETNATLNIIDANATLHDGNYSVIVSNDFGSMETEINEFVVENDINKISGLVGWWKFDETNGTVAYDSSGNGRDGNLTNGPSWTTGKIGGALSFDGTDDHVITHNFFGIAGTNPRSISAWIKTTSLNAVICSYGNFLQSQKWTIRLQNWDGVEGALRTENFNGSIVGSTPVNNGSWFFITSILEPNKSNISDVLHYINGNLDNASHVGSMTIDTVLSSTFVIGRRLLQSNDSNYYFNGLIDDVRIYDRALSAAEVQALYNLGQ